MHTPIKNAVQEAFETVSNDTKFVRLTTLTTIIHSIVFLVYVSFNVYRVIAAAQGNEESMGALIKPLEELFTINNISGVLIGVGLIVVIGYVLLPAIGEAALISYVAADEKKGSASLVKGLTHFFPMFEFNGLITWLLPSVYVIFLSRFWMLDLLGNVLIIIVVVLWGLIVFFVSLFLPFTKFFIVLEDAKPFDAMKQSMQLVLENFGLVLRATLLQYALSVRFIINIILFLGLPLIIVYTATKFDISQSGPVTTLIIIISVIMGILIAYVNGIIEAFFIALRYRLFAQIKK